MYNLLGRYKGTGFVCMTLDGKIVVSSDLQDQGFQCSDLKAT
jgi:hypothetical protein